MTASQRMRVVLALVAYAACFLAGRSTPVEALALRFSGLLAHERTAVETLVREFEHLHPDIKVELSFGAFGVDNQDKLVTEILGGVGPDLVWFNRVTVPAMAAQQLFLPLDNIIQGKSGLDPSAYIPGILEEGTYRGRIYALPVVVDLFGIIWNRDLFAAAGLERDTPPQTWDDLRTVARRLTLTAGDGTLRQVGFSPNNLLQRTWLYTQGAQRGVRFVSTDGQVRLADSRMVDNLQWNADTAESLGGWQAISQFKGSLVAGNVAMDLAREPAILNQLDQSKATFAVGVGPTPVAIGGRPAAYIGGWALAIPVGLPKERLDAAVELMAWLLKPENQVRRFFQSGLGLPAHRQALSQVAASLNRLRHAREIRAYLELASIAVARGTSPINIDVLTGLETAARSVLVNKTSPQEALLEVSRSLQARLDEFNARLRK